MLAFILKVLPFLGKLSFLSKFFAFIPGGQIIAIVGSVFGLIASAIKWLLADIVDAFKEPQRLVVRVLCGLAILGVGVHQGIKWDRHKVDEARAEVAAIRTDLRKKDTDDAQRAAAARAAREAAERSVRQTPTVLVVPAPATAPAIAGPPAPPVQRVRKRPDAPSTNKPGEGVSGSFSSIFGFGK